MTNRTCLVIALTALTACSSAAPSDPGADGPSASSAQALRTPIKPPAVQFTVPAARGGTGTCPVSPLTVAPLASDHITIWIAPEGDKTGVHTVWARVTGPDGERVALIPIAFSAVAITSPTVSPNGYPTPVTVNPASVCNSAAMVQVDLPLSGSWMAKYGVVGDYIVEAIQHDDAEPFDTAVAFASSTITLQ